MSIGIGSVQASGGVFTVFDAQGNSKQVDLGTLMMMLNLQRTENLDTQIAIKLSEIQDRNNLLKSMTELMAAMRKAKADGNGDQTPVTINGKTQPLWKWMDELGLTPAAGRVEHIGKRPDNKDKAAEWDAKWDANINAIKARIDGLNNDSQMSNIQLQNLLEKRGNAFEMATKVMSTNNQSIQSVLRNL